MVIKREGLLRDALVEEGRRMFEQAGATELSMREIARRVGVSEAAPFKHFKGKEDLLAAIASSGFRELQKAREHIAANEQDALARARAMMRSYIGYARAHEGLFNLMIGPRLSAYREGEFGDAGLASFTLFANAICALALEHGWPEHTLEPLTHTAWALEHGVATLLLAGVVPHERSHLDVEELVAFSIDLLLRAIAGGPGPGGEPTLAGAKPSRSKPRTRPTSR